jgi:hypothetical protein
MNDRRRRGGSFADDGHDSGPLYSETCKSWYSHEPIWLLTKIDMGKFCACDLMPPPVSWNATTMINDERQHSDHLRVLCFTMHR